MSLEIQQFQFQQRNPVRAIERDGEVWFVANDVCRALEIVDVSSVVARLDDDEKDTDSIRTPGGVQRVLIVNEPGMYSLILTSRKPEAKAFKRWITHEVLPAIRKTGRYDMLPAKPESELSGVDLLEAMVAQFRKQEEFNAATAARLADIETRQTAMENGTEYFTILAFANRIGRRITNDKALELGEYAGRYSRKHDYPIGQANDSRFGHVNTYHCEVLEAVFGVKS
jgi:prophage antirepressor-like protein